MFDEIEIYWKYLFGMITSEMDIMQFFFCVHAKVFANWCLLSLIRIETMPHSPKIHRTRHLIERSFWGIFYLARTMFCSLSIKFSWFKRLSDDVRLRLLWNIFFFCLMFDVYRRLMSLSEQYQSERIIISCSLSTSELSESPFITYES